MGSQNWYSFADPQEPCKKQSQTPEQEVSMILYTYFIHIKVEKKDPCEPIRLHSTWSLRFAAWRLLMAGMKRSPPVDGIVLKQESYFWSPDYKTWPLPLWNF